MRGWVGWHSTVSWKEAAIGRAKKVQWQWQQHLWNIRLKWNQRTTKEGAGNKGKPQNKDHFMWGWSKATEHATWRVTQTQLVKTILRPHKIVSSATKRLEPTVLKQKQTTRKQQQLHHKDVSRYYFTGTPQQVITASHTTSRLSMGLHLHCPQKE